MKKKKYKVGIIGLGYVGYSLFNTIQKANIEVFGYDVSKKRILNILARNKKINNFISYKINIIKSCNIFIVCVPTPILKNNKPDLKNLIDACKAISKILKPKDLVIFESTVYPGVTKDVCLPKLINNKKKRNFHIAYCPERYSPGDNIKLENITKVVSGENKRVCEMVRKFYSFFINKVYAASSLEEAELIKNFENCQRDHGIALVNELSILCNKSNIDVKKVLKGCLTKWNFNNYKPGLVGGHCISVDPYYLIDFSKSKKFKFSTIENSRKVNNRFINYTKNRITNYLKIKKTTKLSKILFVGITYKKNVDDIRNSGALKIYNSLKKKYNNLDYFDPFFKKKYKYRLSEYKVFILMVLHDKIKGLKKIMKYLNNKKKCFDVFSQLS